MSEIRREQVEIYTWLESFPTQFHGSAVRRADKRSLSYPGISSAPCLFPFLSSSTTRAAQTGSPQTFYTAAFPWPLPRHFPRLATGTCMITILCSPATPAATQSIRSRPHCNDLHTSRTRCIRTLYHHHLDIVSLWRISGRDNVFIHICDNHNIGYGLCYNQRRRNSQSTRQLEGAYSAPRLCSADCSRLQDASS